MDFFSSSYQDARSLFINLAKAKGLLVDSFKYNNDLYTDVVVSHCKLKKNQKVLVLASGVHGIEGFFGSALQSSCLNIIDSLQNDNACDIILIHAINPYGFMNFRRVNEDNIDVNRNFINFDAPLPENKGYAEYDKFFLPQQWGSAEHMQMNENLKQLINKEGFTTAQTAISSGQYTHPKGLFYGGTAPTWSRVSLEAIVARYLNTYKHLIYIDLHTGLGEYGEASLIHDTPKHSKGYDYALAWYGSSISRTDDNSLSAPLSGSSGNAISSAKEVTVSLTLEIGTKPAMEVFQSLLAENWLFARNISDTDPIAKALKAQFKETFFPNDVVWRKNALNKGHQIINTAINGLKLLN